MSAPEYLVCLECESPCYIFEWANDRVIEAQCTVCGNDDPSAFMTEADLEEMAGMRGASEPE
jgi:translation initiation factor 2 beta subunit (eIF-2beta)/eIF-5